MAIHTTTWHPDTCDCVLEYSWDDAVPAEQREHVYAQHIATCKAHAELDGQAAHDAVAIENPAKNKALATVAELHPDIAHLAEVVFSPKVDGHSRKLSVHLPGLTKAERDTLARHVNGHRSELAAARGR